MGNALGRSVVVVKQVVSNACSGEKRARQVGWGTGRTEAFVFFKKTMNKCHVEAWKDGRLQRPSMGQWSAGNATTAA